MSELRQVKASAGSGKTYQLTRRFLGLLDRAKDTAHPFVCTGKPHRGYAWPEIMAVTFTNMAATEMKERVIRGLKLGALDIPHDQRATCAPETAARAVDAVLRRYHRLNIRTIDSLLSLLLRLFALEFGIRPDFQMVFEETELFDAVYDHFTAECATDEEAHTLLDAAFTTLIRDEGRSGFWVQDSVRSRLFGLTRYLRTQSGPLETNQESIKRLLTAAHGDFTDAAKDMATFLDDTAIPANAHFKKFLAKCLAIDIFDGPPDSKLIQKESFRECVLAKGKDLVGDGAELQYSSLQQAWAEYSTHHAALSGAYFIAPAIAIAIRLLAALEVMQKDKGVILGAGLAGFVNDILTHGDAVSEAYCRLGCRLHHLLIDEFQDTSREQWQAITPLSQECLAKGGTLYYVGDVKQAIYGWRGGDSDLFDEILEKPDVAALALSAEAETLPDNWRSFRNVVEFNNDFFRNFELVDQARAVADSQFSSAGDDFKADFAAELMRNFTDCAQSLPPKSLDTGGYVRMEQLPGKKKDEIEAHTLDALDELLDDLLQRRAYKDIAVLVRTHSHASLVCDLLVQRNVPVITENSLQLNRHPIVQQLAALLAFLDFPRDDMAFLTFASGTDLFLAETGLEEEQFHDWLITPKKRPLGVCFRDDFPAHWQRFIEPFYNQSGLMTPYDITQEAIRTFRVFERHPEAELYVRRFLEVIHLAEENGYGSLSAFLEYWTEKSDQEKVPLPENIDAVRIMTIHKSKGLEFPVVIVPFHNWKVQPDRQYDIRQYKGKRFLTPMRKGLGKPYLTSLGRAVREQLNLLYVTWTRAREELYGFFAEASGGYPAQAAINHFLDMDDEPVFEHGKKPDGMPATAQAPRPTPTDLPCQTEDPQLMEWLPRLRVYRHNLDEYFYNQRIRGEVAHKAMEYLRITDNESADISRSTALAMADYPAIAGLPSKEKETLEADVRAMLHWALGHSDLRQWLAEGEREPEVMTDEGQFKRLDLLWRGSDTIVVADFKTGSPDPKNRDQVHNYMRILREMDGNTPVKGYLIYLDLQEIHEVGEDA